MTPVPAPRGGRTRAGVSIALLAVAIILTPLTVVAAWARAQVESTDRYVETVTIVALDEPTGSYVVFMAVVTCGAVAALELVRRHRPQESESAVLGT